MGYTKRRFEREQDLHNLGVRLCIDVGALAECDNHPGSYYDGGGEVEEAYRLANSLISRGEIELESGEDRRTITDAIKGAYEDNVHADGCMSCDKLFNSD